MPEIRANERLCIWSQPPNFWLTAGRAPWPPSDFVSTVAFAPDGIGFYSGSPTSERMEDGRLLAGPEKAENMRELLQKIRTRNGTQAEADTGECLVSADIPEDNGPARTALHENAPVPRRSSPGFARKEFSPDWKKGAPFMPSPQDTNPHAIPGFARPGNVCFSAEVFGGSFSDSIRRHYSASAVPALRLKKKQKNILSRIFSFIEFWR